MSPLVIEALKSLTSRVNLATGIIHPSDESSAKEIFKLLHQEGERLIASEITAWAISHGWQSKDANQLGELAEKIGNGGRVVVKNKGMWRADIIEQFRARANESQN